MTRQSIAAVRSEIADVRRRLDTQKCEVTNTCEISAVVPSTYTVPLVTSDAFVVAVADAVVSNSAVSMNFNPFKPSGVKWLHYKVFKAILV